MSASPEALTREAEELASRLSSYRTNDGREFPDLAERAYQLESELHRRLGILASPEPRIAFVAHMGVGKSTLINALSDLWLDGTPPSPGVGAKQLNQHALLPLGNGGTTPFEVRVEAGPWEVRVEPETPTETKLRLQQFAEWAWYEAHPKAQAEHSAGASDPSGREEGGGSPRLQPDLERVVRGLTDLHEHTVTAPPPSGGRTRRGAAARTVKTDEAVVAAAKFPAKADYVGHVVQRANLDARRREQWLPAGDAPRWLRETLLNLHQGKYQDQPFPRRVTVRAPSKGVSWRGRAVPLIDTLGLPAVAAGKSDGESATRETAARSLPAADRPLAERGDLRDLLQDPWCVVVLGAQFNSPPAPAVEILKQMMEEGNFFGESLEDRTVIAIVDRGDAGVGIGGDAETDRATKEDWCARQLGLLGCPRGLNQQDRWSTEDARERVLCVNVLDGGIDAFREFLGGAVEGAAVAHARRLEVAVEDARTFYENRGKKELEALRKGVVERFKGHLAAVAEAQRGKVRAYRSNLLHPFSDDGPRALHHSTVRSIVVNRGDGTRNAWSILQSATNYELRRLLSPLLEDLTHTSQALMSEARYANEDCRKMVEEEADRRRRTLEAFLLEFLSALVDATKSQLRPDPQVWQECESEWGRGIKDPRYKERVARHFDAWGVQHSPELLERLADLRERATADDTGMLASLIDNG